MPEFSLGLDCCCSVAMRTFLQSWANYGIGSEVRAKLLKTARMEKRGKWIYRMKMIKIYHYHLSDKDYQFASCPLALALVNRRVYCRNSSALHGTFCHRFRVGINLLLWCRIITLIISNALSCHLKMKTFPQPVRSPCDSETLYRGDCWGGRRRWRGRGKKELRKNRTAGTCHSKGRVFQPTDSQIKDTQWLTAWQRRGYSPFHQKLTDRALPPQSAQVLPF